tara:strand:- start:157 stop:837 length:681 start_codon:yes stop_codon:yes gene_type:complete
MKLFNVILAGLIFGSAIAPVRADESKVKGWYTMDAMGCMLLRECNDGVVEVKTMDDVVEYYGGDYPYSAAVEKEFNRLVTTLNKMGTKVHIAHKKYFPRMHRGVYHTVSNHFYLNETYMHKPHTLMSVMRHEGWHAAQDCMAGTNKNTLMAIIHPEEDVPKMWRNLVERTYANHAVPWEAEAYWAGHTANMTQDALDACVRGNMWEEYPPTPMTKAWLIENNYIKE